MTQVLVVHGEELVREGISSLLSRILQEASVTTAFDEESARQGIDSGPDIVILDSNLESLHSLTEYIDSTPTNTSVVLLGPGNEVLEPDEAGKTGGQLILAIIEALQPPNRLPKPAKMHLPPHHLRVLRALGAGRKASEIASDYGLATSTVKAYMRAAYLALGAHSKAEALAISHRMNLLNPEEPDQQSADGRPESATPD